MSKLLFTFCIIGILLFPICSFAQSTSNDSTILGIDTSTYFTAIESLVQNAIQSWNGIVVDKDGDISYQNGYDLWEGKGLLGSADSTGTKQILAPNIGVITDWHKSGGIFAGVNLFKKGSDLEDKYHINIKIAGFVEGTTDSSKDNWNAGGFLAGRISLNK